MPNPAARSFFLRIDVEKVRHFQRDFFHRAGNPIYYRNIVDSATCYTVVLRGAWKVFTARIGVRI